MSLSVIILTYWPERVKAGNVHKIVAALKSGTHMPDKVYIWNNNKDFEIFPTNIFGAEIINSTYNFHCLVRHALGLIAETDLCLFIDDDLMLDKNGLEELVEWHNVVPDSVIGYRGLNMNWDSAHPYTKGEYVEPLETGFQRADIILGRLHLCKTSLLWQSFYALSQVMLDGIIEEDILLSLANMSIGLNENYVVAVPVIELSECDVGYHYTESHYPRRDKTCRILIDNL